VHVEDVQLLAMIVCQLMYHFMQAEVAQQHIEHWHVRAAHVAETYVHVAGDDAAGEQSRQKLLAEGERRRRIRTIDGDW